VKNHSTRFTYTLEEFGFDAGLIENEPGDLFERFGWDDEPGNRSVG